MGPESTLFAPSIEYDYEVLTLTLVGGTVRPIGPVKLFTVDSGRFLPDLFISASMRPPAAPLFQWPLEAHTVSIACMLLNNHVHSTRVTSLFEESCARDHNAHAVAHIRSLLVTRLCASSLIRLPGTSSEGARLDHSGARSPERCGRADTSESGMGTLTLTVSPQLCEQVITPAALHASLPLVFHHAHRIAWAVH